MCIYMYMHCYIGAHVGACSVALVRMWVYALLHWCACGCIRSLALCAEDAIAAHCAEHLLLYMFVDALAAHCAEHILLYIRHVFRARKFMLALTLGSSALSSSYRVGLAGRLHHLLRAAASARMASDFGESPWESPELAGDDSQADSVSTVPVRRPANAAPPSPDSIWTQASSLAFRSLGPKPADAEEGGPTIPQKAGPTIPQKGGQIKVKGKNSWWHNEKTEAARAGKEV